VEYAYAKQNHMTYTQLKNSAGAFVEPNQETFAAAAVGAKWAKAKDFYLIMTNAPGKKSWPIAGSTFILMHKTQANAEQAQAVLKFFSWSYLRGQKAATELYYVPIPASVTKLIQKEWKNKIKSSKGAPIVVGI
jgi:phosphate transport system substrate-binding protein